MLKVGFTDQAKTYCCRGPELDGGFVAKASSLEPRPSHLYLEAQMDGRYVSWGDKEAIDSLISLKLTRGLGLADA